MAAFTALAVAGLALSAYGQIRAGQAAKRQGEAGKRAAESEAQLAEYNAAVADLQAQDAVARGGQEESKFRTNVRTMIGSQRAGFAGSNVDVAYGSAVDVQTDAAFLGELDALTIRTNAAREAWGYQVQGEDLRRRAEITRKEGVMAAEAGRAQAGSAYWGAAGTLLTGTSSLLETRYGYGRIYGGRR